MPAMSLSMSLGSTSQIQILRDDSVVRIDVLIILAVIFVIGRGNKNRVQIDTLNSQTFQIIKFIPDSLQIPSVEPAHIKVLRKLLPVGDSLNRASDIDVFIRFHIVGRITVAEAIHIDLVYNGALHPLRHVKTGDNLKGIGGIRPVLRPQAVVITDFTAQADLKAVGTGPSPSSIVIS